VVLYLPDYSTQYSGPPPPLRKMIVEEDEPKLLNWVVVQLNNMNQSNASFIAKYIITLLRQNKSTTEDYKAYFIDELKSFLKARTISFVNNLFDVIAGMAD